MENSLFGNRVQFPVFGRICLLFPKGVFLTVRTAEILKAEDLLPTRDAVCQAAAAASLSYQVFAFRLDFEFSYLLGEYGLNDHHVIMSSLDPKLKTGR